jgi:hypothetical protein
MLLSQSVNFRRRDNLSIPDVASGKRAINTERPAATAAYVGLFKKPQETGR